MSPLSTSSCPILARLPLCAARFQDNLGILQCVRVQLILLLDCWCLLRAPCCCFPRTANTQIQELQNSKHCHLPDVSHSVSSLHLSASTAEIHRCGQVCRQKLLTSTSCSIWLHPLNDFGPNKFLQMAPLLQCSPCPGQNDKAFSRYPSHGNCAQPMHSVEPSSPSTHDQVQFLSCISLRHHHEMLEAVPELSNLLVLHVPNSLSSLFRVAVTIKIVDGHRLIKVFATSKVCGSWSHFNSAQTKPNRSM